MVDFGRFCEKSGRGLEISSKGGNSYSHFAGFALCNNDFSRGYRKHSCNFGKSFVSFKICLPESCHIFIIRLANFFHKRHPVGGIVVEINWGQKVLGGAEI